MSVHWDPEDLEDAGDAPGWMEKHFPRVMAVFAVALGDGALMFALEESRWDLAGLGLAALLVSWCFWRES